MFLAALGKRDAEIAAGGTIVLSGTDRPRVHRQAIKVAISSLATGVALTLAAMALLALG